jgi:hypothetical protein
MPDIGKLGRLKAAQLAETAMLKDKACCHVSNAPLVIGLLDDGVGEVELGGLGCGEACLEAVNGKR